jgi:hypothetical protein
VVLMSPCMLCSSLPISISSGHVHKYAELSQELDFLGGLVGLKKSQCEHASACDPHMREV